MKTTLKDNTLTLYLEGRIDSNNAAQAEQEAMAAVAGAPGAELVLDAEKTGVHLLRRAAGADEAPEKGKEGHSGGKRLPGSI